MSLYDIDEPLTSTARPLTDSVLTIRIIKSFPYRNVKNHILPHVDLKTTTAKQLFDTIVSTINTTGGLRPYRNVPYDTLKIYTHAHGSKTMNLVINMDHDDDWILDLKNADTPLFQYGIENETEISIFNKEQYEEFKKNPEEKW
ncbi:hypothetical protein CANARDRAFT_202306 [[Candida] arabinofermentans NRRL YB-2248]|uniref:Altered inheritance rate of mitochondria protein 29 n=1 Tax=[Candida] arabinofermentans NRRL YB-2248 TaxID=983967 RepID=A0A1E4SWE4_9ASCO|nr:hypothetical protein CANARDRAFT_202306 [[Candida] arabinofermentans NRRL YB-2248]